MLPSGGSITYTVSATVLSSATGALSNTASVTAANGVTNIDPNSVNGSTSATDTDTLTPQADLQITKDDGQTTAIPGTGLTYTITVTNTGPSDAPGTLVSDMFPANLTGVSYTVMQSGGASGATDSSGDISQTVSLPSGGSITYSVSATVQSSATGSLSNTATVTAPNGVTNIDPGSVNGTTSAT